MVERPPAANPAPPKQDAGYPPFVAAMREWSDPTNPIWKRWACGHPRRPKQSRQPWEDCPPCAAQKRHCRKYIAGHIAILLIQILLGCLWAAEAVR